jgi:hypothetical protein
MTAPEQIGDDVSVAGYALASNRATEAHLRKTWPDWQVSFSQQMAVLMQDEIIEICQYKAEASADGVGPVFGVCVLEYDFLGRGYTAYRPINDDEAQELYRFYERDPVTGREAWLCRWHKVVPYDAMRKRIEASGRWDCAALAVGFVPDGFALPSPEQNKTET